MVKKILCIFVTLFVFLQSSSLLIAVSEHSLEKIEAMEDADDEQSFESEADFGFAVVYEDDYIVSFSQSPSGFFFKNPSRVYDSLLELPDGFRFSLLKPPKRTSSVTLV